MNEYQREYSQICKQTPRQVLQNPIIGMHLLLGIFKSQQASKSAREKTITEYKHKAISVVLCNKQKDKMSTIECKCDHCLMALDSSLIFVSLAYNICARLCHPRITHLENHLSERVLPFVLIFGIMCLASLIRKFLFSIQKKTNKQNNNTENPDFILIWSYGFAVQFAFIFYFLAFIVKYYA